MLLKVTIHETREEMSYKTPPETEFQKYIRATKYGKCFLLYQIILTNLLLLLSYSILQLLRKWTSLANFLYWINISFFIFVLYLSPFCRDDGCCSLQRNNNRKIHSLQSSASSIIWGWLFASLLNSKKKGGKIIYCIYWSTC